MAVDTIQSISALTVISCGVCHISFAVPADFDVQRRRDHRTFSCPKGCRISYVAQSDLERANDALAKEKHLREQAEARAERRSQQLVQEQQETQRVARRLSATQGVVTRHKKKIAAGKCPCCSVAFKDLAMHMKTKHPKWDPTKEAEVRSHG